MYSIETKKLLFVQHLPHNVFVASQRRVITLTLAVLGFVANKRIETAFGVLNDRFNTTTDK